MAAPLAKLGIVQPTPIQTKAIPLILSARDVMGLAQTGTGKTAAFGLPLVQRLMEDGLRPEPKGVRALILAPTRELVNQIADNLRTYVKGTKIWVSSVVGGQSINSQIKHLAKGTDILVATPGRLLDLADRRAIQLRTAKFLVLDEADQMLDMGFIHALRKIEKLLGTPRQTMLFSATMPKEVAELSKGYLTDPVRVEVSPPGKAADKVEQSVHFVPTRDKATLLKDLLRASPDALSLVFSRTKHGAEKLMKHLVAEGFDAASIHGNKSQGQRDRALRGFKSGETRILVATDVAARGIDIPGVTHVYNYNMPEVAEAYVHRIGRTARAGRDGLAVAFCAPDERPLLRQVEKLLKMDIAVAGGDPNARMGLDDEPAAPKQQGRGGRGGGGGGGRGGPARAGRPGGAGKPAGQAKPQRADGKSRAARASGGGKPSGGNGRPGGRPNAQPGARPSAGPGGRPRRSTSRPGKTGS
ncbi:DEAD/DEAH box helicase [Rhizobiaceae bacterium]|nr:DEAD/DEAH box helicase [Rhizobiaceae bacterium]